MPSDNDRRRAIVNTAHLNPRVPNSTSLTLDLSITCGNDGAVYIRSYNSAPGATLASHSDMEAARELINLLERLRKLQRDMIANAAAA